MITPTKDDGNSKAKLKATIAYKSRSHSSESEEYLSLSKCFLPSTFMKILKLKNGDYLLIEKGNEGSPQQFLSKSWSCKPSQISNETIFLNKSWQPCFDGYEKNITVNLEKLANVRVVDCSQAEIWTNRLSLTDIASNVILQLLHNLQDVFCVKGLIFTLPINGLYESFQIVNTVSRRRTSPGIPVFYKIVPTTQIILKKEVGPSRAAAIVCRTSSQFVGHRQVKDNLIRIVQSSIHHSEDNLRGKVRGILIHGPPGCGKTQLMEDIVFTLDCNIIKIDHSILLRSAEGEAEAALRKYFSEAKASSPTIIQIDHFDLICPQRSATITSDIQKRIVTTFLTLMDEIQTSDDVVVLACTSKFLDVDEAAKRVGRMDFEIEIPIPSEADRFDILQHLLAKQGVSFIDETPITPECRFFTTFSAVKQISRDAHGMVGSDLLQVIKESFYVASMKISSTKSLADSLENLSLQPSPPIELSLEIMDAALKKIAPSSLREITIEVPSVRWEDIGGMERVKDSLRQVIELPLKHPELFRQSGMMPLKGVLLFGPPGCSKTLMAKAVATETSMNFLAVRGPELLSKWLGDSEKAVQSLFRKARAAAPSIIFFDEIDALAGVRGDASSGVSDRVLSQLLVELDGINSQKHLIVIAATNRPDMLDSALIRPGRIDRKIYVPPPDGASRRRIFEIEFKKIPYSEDVDLYKLVELSEGFSGAEVVAVCNDAVLLAIEDNADFVTMKNLELSLKKINPQITQTMLAYYEKFLHR